MSVNMEVKEMDKISDSNKLQKKRGRKKGCPAPPGAWKPGQSGNPRGAPVQGTSWAAVIKVVSEMTAKQLADFVGSGWLQSQLAKMPQTVSMKYLVVIRWFVAQMNDPSPSLAGVIMDREDGKVAGDTGSNTTIVYVGRDSKWEPNMKSITEIEEAQKMLGESNR